jgi:hypothetical protein
MACPPECEGCAKYDDCPMREQRQKVMEHVVAEYGKDALSYLEGMAHAAIVAAMHGFEPATLLVGINVGLALAQDDPEFASKLRGICGYATQVNSPTGGGVTEQLVEALADTIREPTKLAGFGWLKEEGEAHES